MSKKNGHSRSETWIKTKLELARLLGISRPTLDAYSVLPGFPQVEARGWPLERCKAFTALQVNRREESRLLELELLKEQVAQAQMRTGREAGELIPREWSRLLFAHLAVSVRRIVHGAAISEEAKGDITAKVEAINADDFLAQLAREAGEGNGADEK